MMLLVSHLLHNPHHPHRYLRLVPLPPSPASPAAAHVCHIYNKGESSDRGKGRGVRRPLLTCRSVDDCLSCPSSASSFCSALGLIGGCSSCCPFPSFPSVPLGAIPIRMLWRGREEGEVEVRHDFLSGPREFAPLVLLSR